MIFSLLYHHKPTLTEWAFFVGFSHYSVYGGYLFLHKELFKVKTMFGTDRNALRKLYCDSWGKFISQMPLSALEQQIVSVIKLHPEYHQMMETPEVSLGADFSPEMGESNPFLHMGMHLGLHEQISTNRPTGIQQLYQQLVSAKGEHDAEHQMMECLGEAIWTAQRNQTMPDEVSYFECLKRLTNSSAGLK
jgi:hypothetical protein